MTPQQQAEYRDGIARAKLAHHRLVMEQNRDSYEERKTTSARPKKNARRKLHRLSAVSEVPLPPKSEQPMRPRDGTEAALASRLRACLCEDSVVDLDRHAIGVARMIIQLGNT